MGNGDQAEGPGAFYPGGCLIGISTHIGDETVMATTTAQIQQLYVAYLGRAADKAGLDYWSQQLNAVPATLTLENLRANFVNEQAEYKDAYAGLSRSDTVIKVYNNLFGRAPDTAGLTYWTTGAGSTVNADQLLTAFVNGASTTDATVLNNKVLVSEVYTSAAGANYSKADATSIISAVDSTSSSVGKAIAKLEDGSLSGIAIPAGVAALKAEALAEKAILDFHASKVTELSDLNKALFDLKASSGSAATLEASATPATGTDLAYEDVDQALTNAGLLRESFGAATPVLESLATQAGKDLDATRLVYTKATIGNVDKAVAYENALKAAAGLKAADETLADTAIQKSQVDFTAKTADTDGAAALAKANADAGLPLLAVKTTEDLYAALTKGTATKTEIKAITDAFDVLLKGSADYATLKSLAATDYAKNSADQAVTDTLSKITGDGSADYKQDVTDKIAADKALANAKAADALVSKADAITAADKVLAEAAKAIEVPSTVKDLADNVGTAKADLFHFADGKVTSDDFKIGGVDGFAKGDALYIGEGYTLNTGAKFDATAGTLTGGKNGSLEVFFIKDAGVVKAVIETADLGSSTFSTASLAGTTSDKVSIIELSGVSDIAQVSFSNGIISHVA